MEKYHTWSFIPILDTDCKPLGMYNPTRETTAAVLARRRQETMRALSEQLLVSRTIPEYFESLAFVSDTNVKDIPFLVCYSCDEGEQDVTLKLRSKVGTSDNNLHTPQTITLPRPHAPRRRGTHTTLDRMSSNSLSVLSGTTTGSRVIRSADRSSWPIARALATRQCVLVDDCTELIADYPLRVWQALPTSAIVIPICSETSHEPARGVLIMGLNVACPLDVEYEDWIYVMRAHLTSSLGSIIAYEAEQQRLVDIERMEKAKTAWFQGAAHDLRSPLTLVAGPLDDVLNSNLSPPQRKALALAQRNLTRVQRLVNALLDFSRIEAGKLAGRFVPTDLGSFVGDLAALFRPAMERRKVGYTINIQQYDGVVYIDPTLLETVITNLISNALKYTESGSIQVKLTYGEYADISVVDTGIGIPAGELSSVTDRFNRATTALSRGTEGTGIGLALAKEIVRLHNGELLITSEVAEETGGTHGSTFTARIPLTPRDVDMDGIHQGPFGTYGQQIVDEAMHWGGPSEADTDSTAGDSLDAGMNGRSDVFLFEKTDVLLLVDDNFEMRNYIKGIFTPFCTVIEASDGVQGLEMARKHKPDMILSDLMMPRMNGQELLAAIRKDATTQNIPMVLLSAATDEELRLSALLVGAEDFMLKPFKPKELLARVHLHMQLGKRRNLLQGLYTQRERETAVLVDYCPSGIVRANAQGSVVYCNDAWRGYCGLGVEHDPDEWPSCISDETRQYQLELWHRIVYGDERETQATWKWSNGKTVSGTFIRLDKVDPSLSGVLGCLSDISYQEERLLEAERRRLEAEESKRQQELLVDLTSHEIRTPVSAILQCSSMAKENLVVLNRELKDAGVEGFKPNGEVLNNLEQDIEALESA
jgi:signal transduction histidine kinase/CheY-like chemotaxis protein